MLRFSKKGPIFSKSRPSTSSTKHTAWGFPIDTAVRRYSFPATSTGSFIIILSKSTGIFSGSSMAFPISTHTVSTLPSFTFSLRFLTPLNVSTVISVLLTMPLSYKNFPTHLMPFPHILASLPSALNILILASALSEGHIIISPSEPTLKCLGDTAIAISSGFSSSLSIQLT